jgi:quinol monooxygenase YgiN
MSLTLVNFFTVPEAEADNFLARFKGIAERMRDTPGFEGTDLHRYAGVGDPTYAFVNIAKWESAEAWRAALPQIMSGGGLGSGVIPKAALYESVFRFPGDQA